MQWCYNISACIAWHGVKCEYRHFWEAIHVLSGTYNPGRVMAQDEAWSKMLVVRYDS